MAAVGAPSSPLELEIPSDLKRLEEQTTFITSLSSYTTHLLSFSTKYATYLTSQAQIKNLMTVARWKTFCDFFDSHKLTPEHGECAETSVAVTHASFETEASAIFAQAASYIDFILSSPSSESRKSIIKSFESDETMEKRVEWLEFISLLARTAEEKAIHTPPRASSSDALAAPWTGGRRSSVGGSDAETWVSATDEGSAAPPPPVAAPPPEPPVGGVYVPAAARDALALIHAVRKRQADARGNRRGPGPRAGAPDRPRQSQALPDCLRA